MHQLMVVNGELELVHTVLHLAVVHSMNTVSLWLAFKPGCVISFIPTFETLSMSDLYPYI